MAAIRSCLRDLGIAPGDRVAMTVADGLPAAVSFLGLAPACALAPFNPHYTAAEFDRLFADLRPRALVVAGADPAVAIAAAEARGVPVWRIVAPADDNGWRLDGSPVGAARAGPARRAHGRRAHALHVRDHVAAEARAAHPGQPVRVGVGDRADAGAHARRSLPERDAALPHPRSRGRAPRVARRRSERGVHAGIQRGRLSRVGGRDRPDLVHGRADDAPGRAGARRAAARRGRPSPLPFRPVVVVGAVAAGHGGDRAGVRGAGRRGVRHDRGVAPDGEQSAAARAAEAGYRRAAGGSGDCDLRGGSRRAAGGWRKWGNLHPRRGRHGGLSRQPRGECGGVRRRVVSHGRSGDDRRRRLPDDYRAHQGAHQPRRREDRAARGGRGAARAPGGRVRRRVSHSRSKLRRAGGGSRRASALEPKRRRKSCSDSPPNGWPTSRCRAAS